MSFLWRAAWTLSGEEAHREAAELAREGTALIQAFGGAPPATALAWDSDGAAVDTWTDRYAEAAQAHGMPLDVLWAGVFGLDPRADNLIAPLLVQPQMTWAEITAMLAAKNAPQAVRNVEDWFASRSLGLVNGNEQQTTQERYHRAWWGALARAMPQNATTPPTNTPPTNTPPASSSSAGGWKELAMIIGIGLLASKGRKGRR